MDACRTYLLLLILFQTLASNVFAQERDVVRADGELYIKDNGQLYRIDQNTLLAQVKQDRLEKYSSQSSLLSKRLSIICVSVPQNVAVEKYKKELETSGDFEIVEFNSYFKPSSFSPNDTYLPTQWYLDRIKMPEAWDIQAEGDFTEEFASSDAILKLYSKLKPEEREFLNLRYVVGLKDAEVGSLLNLNEKAVNKRYQRLLAKCRTFMD